MQEVGEGRCSVGSLNGLSLSELLIMLVIVSLLCCISVPGLGSTRASLESKKVAREVVSVLRACRSRAITTKREHRVEFDSANKRYRVMQADNRDNRHAWGVVVQDWTAVDAANINIQANVPAIHFNPAGTSNLGTVTVLDTATHSQLRVIVNRIGRIRIS